MCKAAEVLYTTKLSLALAGMGIALFQVGIGICECCLELVLGHRGLLHALVHVLEALIEVLDTLLEHFVLGTRHVFGRGDHDVVEYSGPRNDCQSTSQMF
jgi:hypothetical protein